jgi:ABC-type polar amino acid transport system ATPase subunit
MNDETKTAGKEKKGDAVINIKGLAKSFGKNDVLKDVNLELHKEENLVNLVNQEPGNR